MQKRRKELLRGWFVLFLSGIEGARTCAQHLIMRVTFLSPPSLPQKRANLPCAQVRRRHSRRFRPFPTARDVSEPFSQTYNTFVAPSLWRSSPRLHQSKPKTNHSQVKVVLGFFLFSFHCILFKVSRKRCQFQIKNSYKMALKLRVCRIENTGGSPSGSAATARSRAL